MGGTVAKGRLGAIGRPIVPGPTPLKVGGCLLAAGLRPGTASWVGMGRVVQLRGHLRHRRRHADAHLQGHHRQRGQLHGRAGLRGHRVVATRTRAGWLPGPGGWARVGNQVGPGLEATLEEGTGGDGDLAQGTPARWPGGHNPLTP